MASCRALNNTDESTASASLQEDIRLTNALVQQLDDAQDDCLKDDDVSASALCRLLSLRAECTTTSSCQRISQEMKVPFRKVGFGQCGIIYARSTGYVLKLAKKHFEDSLLGDLRAHLRVYQALADHPTDCRIPSVYKYVTASNSSWWEANSHFFTTQDELELPTMALATQHILPLPKIVRTALIDLYCPEEHKATATENPSNKDCLARVYLGRSRLPNTPKSPNFTLRNFNLHLDQMLELNLPILDYSRAIGEALAVIHWRANVDAYDIEFVLGSEAEAIYHPEPTTVPQVRMKAEEVESMPTHTDIDEIVSVNFKQRSTRLWVLDFNLCSRWDMTQVLTSGGENELVEHLVQAFFENDPYYPRPIKSGTNGTGMGQVREQLWGVFSSAYLNKSKAVLAGSTIEGGLKERLLELPEDFIACCIADALFGQKSDN
ncbi:unnamed protein product [Clonostachys rhizophaga]|uniref:DUF3669 domain-containing protein n=1 Tax=Clonostachys rhizophaga TaxID=160324 RepID=A0A9N9VEM8_9HYPO|nr:unnamed protein product [Clonostachys rhizophaga]